MATSDAKKQYDGEIVVLHDMISYGDPEHDPVPGQPKGLLYAERGTVLGTDDHPAPTNQEVRRLMNLGAVTDDHGTLDAKLALRGERPTTGLAGPYISLTNPQEQVRAAKAVAMASGSGPLSNPNDLAKLAIGDLKVMAAAFGYPDLAESDSKDEIVKALTQGRGDDAQSAAETARHRQARDEVQVQASEGLRAGGLVGANVTAQGKNAETGERTTFTDEDTAPGQEGRRKSAAQQDDVTGETDEERQAREAHQGGGGGFLGRGRSEQ